MTSFSLSLLLSLFLLSPNVGGTEMNENPFTAKASLIRYWKNHISNDLPKPNFFLSKASPLGPTDSAILTKLVDDPDSLSSNLNSLCSSAHLLCFSNDDVSQQQEGQSNTQSDAVSQDANFATYTNRNFANYGSSRLRGADSFKNYSDGLNSPNDSFRKYSKDSNSHSEQFASYATNGNTATSSFTGYAADATSGSGEFKIYHQQVNVPNLQFSSYDSDANHHRLSFGSYGSETNSGSQSFLSYGKKGNADPNEFTSYAEEANTLGSDFNGYGEFGNGGNNSFKSYGVNGNNPKSTFKSYGTGGKAGIEGFTNYRNGANVGSSSFQSYARNSNSEKVTFSNYGKSFNLGNDSFRDYGKGSVGQTTVGFNSYSLGRTFKDYTRNGVTFAEYNNFTTATGAGETNGHSHSGIAVNKMVEPGKFFRESSLKEGNIMAMPDIRDRMAERSFLPRFILRKLPFSTSRISNLRKIFHAPVGSTMEHIILNALEECERAPSPGETKRCVGSAEGMIDFAVSVLGRNVVVRTTENVNGSKGEVMIGKVRGINGGKLTKSVSCHQTLYPYLLYYCHSVPKVRVYVADILDVASKKKINRGVAICHIDTSSWAPGHGAFVALGSGPGKIEVCHWIFENDMSWATAD